MQNQYVTVIEQEDCIRVRVLGEWTLDHFEHLQQKVAQITLSKEAKVNIDLSDLKQMDTVGVTVLVDLLGLDNLKYYLEYKGKNELPVERLALITTVVKALTEDQKKPKLITDYGFVGVLENIGDKAVEVWQNQKQLLGFTGLTLVELFKIFSQPRRWRVTSVVSHIESSCLNAVPIIALMTLMVGAVVAFLGATVLNNFGATIYTIQLVAFSFLREFATLLTAILVAGRTASAFTAQIGSMKINEELDALKASGLSPIELLVIPRVFALLISLPMLTLIGMICGIAGGMLVCKISLDISPQIFLTQVSQTIGLKHFMVGIVKAPVMAFVIGVIGCVEGFKVGNSAESVGQHTTSSVVQCIFMAILLDAIFALFFMEMGW